MIFLIDVKNWRNDQVTLYCNRWNKEVDVKRAKFRLKCLKLIKSNIDIREAKMFRARTTLRVNSQ